MSFVDYVLCRKEITTLQFENDSLERQLFSYQKSIAFAHSRKTYSDDLTLEDSRPEDDEQYFEGGDYSLGDRSLSTDTEYAWGQAISRSRQSRKPIHPGRSW